jgi:acyl carrier protein
MDHQPIFERITELIGPYNKNQVEVGPQTSFATDLQLDSLAVMDLVASIEDEWDIVLPINMLPELDTVQQLAQAVARLVGAK